MEKMKSSDTFLKCRTKIRQLLEKTDVTLIKESNEYGDSYASFNINLETDIDKKAAKEQQKERIPQKETYILADVRRSSTIKDDIGLIFLNSMMGSIIQSCVDSKYMETEVTPSTSNQTNTQSEKESSQTTEISTETKSRSLSSSSKKGSSCDESGSYIELDSVSSVTVLQAQSQRYSDTSSQRKRQRKRGRILKDQSNNVSRVSKVVEETLSMLDDYAREDDETFKQTDITNKILEQEEITDNVQEHIDWRISFCDQDVFIIFTQGNTYEGHISRKLMEGYGKFNWTDGTSYEGNFEGGRIIGEGKLTFSDLSWYEGEFYHGIRHGKGHYVSNDGQISYYGHWYLGKKHGTGTLYYGDKNNSYYSGEFFDGERHGYGSRQYPSGARYFGEWKQGQRHGIGTMVFPNNDVYSGNWANGLMNGQGEYIWNAFVNKTFTQPTENIYRGYWVNGLRSGKGALLRTCGGNIFGEWVDDKKHGPGMVLCFDGSIIRGDPLFIDDNLAENPNDTLVINPSKMLKKEKPFEKSPKKINKRSPSITFSMTHEVSKSRLGGTFKKVTKTQIMHKSKGNPRKINLHDSKIDLSYQLLQLLKSMGKTRQIPEESENSNFDMNIIDESKVSTISNNNGENSDTYKECVSYIKNTSFLSNNKKQSLVKDTVVSIDGEDTTKHEQDFNKNEEPSLIRDKEVLIKEIDYEKLYNNVLNELLYDNETKKLVDFENKWLNKVILLNIYDLHNILQKYAKIACEQPIEYEIKCLRIMLWQFMRDCGFNQKGFSLVEVDERVALNPHSHVLSVFDPFEKIEFHQFMHYLLELSWMLYASKRIGYEEAPGILASAFVKLINDDILPNAGNHKGMVLFKYIDLLPFDAVYSLYRSFGEPHSARTFLTSVCIPRKVPLPEPLPPQQINPNWYPEFIRNGKNAIYLANNIIYLAGQEPLSYSMQEWNKKQTSGVKQHTDPYATLPLSLRNLGPRKVTELLASVCPGIKSEQLICNFDYKLSFLEFYEVLLLCAECSILKELEEAAKETETSVTPLQPSTATEQESKSHQGSARTPKKKKTK